MPDAFDCVAAHVRSACKNELICVHVDNAQQCEVKRHPSYEEFRHKAVASRASRATKSRLWDSMVAMGRLSDMRGDDKWRMILLDCLTPFLRKRSEMISRTFYADLHDIRSEMITTAMDTWKQTATGVAPREVPTLMVKASVTAAYRSAKIHSSEYEFENLDELHVPEDTTRTFAVTRSAIIHNADLRDPAIAEQVRGEAHGARLQKFVPQEVLTAFHEEVRAGTRSRSASILTTPTMLARTFVTGGDHYYHVSDFYPAFIGLPVAAEALDIPPSSAYRMVRAGSFPCPTTYMGRKLQVHTRALMHHMGVPDIIVHPDDVENGAAHARGGSV
ncbi:hypothetical protein [Streptomyces flavalbus]|uniref:Uncharacterized protein n=1 Tax=Streptomyces flavalbus TaxID=2665155 RepID=A0ABW2WHU0_9ACTN